MREKAKFGKRKISMKLEVIKEDTGSTEAKMEECQRQEPETKKPRKKTLKLWKLFYLL